MRPIYLTQTGSGSTPAVPLDSCKDPFIATVAVIVTGTVNYTVQHTFDDVTVGITTWWNNLRATGLTENASVQYTSGVTAVQVTVNSGTGSVAVQIIQGTRTS